MFKFWIGLKFNLCCRKKESDLSEIAQKYFTTDKEFPNFDRFHSFNRIYYSYVQPYISLYFTLSKPNGLA